MQMMSSVYPWFHASRTFGDVLIGAIDGLVDGAIAGLLFGWLYNLHAGTTPRRNTRRWRRKQSSVDT
jgi:hypothetical protein